MLDLEIKLTQRYYHLVALRGDKETIKKEFFRRWQISENKKINIGGSCMLYHMSMTSSTPYYRIDLNEQNTTPYILDIIVIEYQEANAIIIGFPFKKLAMDLVSSLVKDYNILAKSNFIKIDMVKLLKANNRHTDLYYNENHFWLSGVFITLTGDSFLSTVKLAGDKPLDSDIYKNYFKQKLLSSQKSGLEKCILKSEIDVDHNDILYGIKSAIHIDKFGNYKLYLQSKGKNLLAIPLIFEFLKHLECLVETPNNPVYHITNEE